MDKEEPTYRILLVEDDARLASMVADFLSTHGFDTAVEGRGDAAVDRIRAEPPDAVVLDVNLPGLNGFAVCQSVRSEYRGAIIMLTARDEEADEVMGLAVGADDYMAKPVRPRVLLARLRSHLRRAIPTEAEARSKPIRVGSLVVDPSRRHVEIDETAIEMTSAEFDLLHLLAQHAGETLSRNEIYLHIHGVKYDGIDRSIDLRISRLRRKLGDDSVRPHRIKSVRGVGYILSVEP